MAGYGFWARLKTIAGFSTPPTIAISGTTLLSIADNSNSFYVTGASTPVVSTINALIDTMPGRIVHFEATSSVGSGVVFTNNDSTTTKGQMDLGGSDVTLGSTDVLCLKQRPDGVWVRQYNTNN